jgi:DNA-binding NarL/FixJ family response regulator
MEGIDAARAIRIAHPNVGIVVLSQYNDSLYALELFRDGTAGLAYLLKDRVGDRNELVRALDAVVAGGSMIDPLIVERLLARRRKLAPSPLESLTPREHEVLALMAQGLANGAIATEQGVTQSAIEKHVNAIFSKLLLDPEDAATHRRVRAVLTFLDHSAET